MDTTRVGVTAHDERHPAGEASAGLNAPRPLRVGTFSRGRVEPSRGMMIAGVCTRRPHGVSKGCEPGTYLESPVVQSTSMDRRGFAVSCAEGC